jgi:hypothetical protein
MDKDDLRNIEVYCQTEACGDPVPSMDGVVRYTKRRMNFAGFHKKFRFLLSEIYVAIYKCPVCGKVRYFRLDEFGDHYIETSHWNT